jgi:hypothetical protein
MKTEGFDTNRSVSCKCLVGKFPFVALNGHFHKRSINMVFIVFTTLHTVLTCQEMLERRTSSTFLA